MVEICALASGSNGNCYYIGNENDAILIDLGIHFNTLKERAEKACIDLNKVRAVFITHEHCDHVQGAHAACKKMQWPIFFNKKTFNNTLKNRRPDIVSFFENDTEVNIGSMIVYPFSKSHDASCPCSFRIEINGMNIGVMTDIGIAEQPLATHFALCNAAFLESNYDEEMLWKGPYPAFLKHRVASHRGHLSNTQSSDFVRNNATNKLRYLFLSHISAENNTIDKALAAFAEFDQFQVLPTYRHEPSQKLILI
ncbi:MAG: MBL fold metallo-hydrolase [Salinivirgaceae bacterium]|nr:MBL fold metallo-hydrolase [Salinivirgaceae bacterium]